MSTIASITGRGALPPRHASVVHMLAATAAAQPEAIALKFGEQNLDYRGYLGAVAGFAGCLREHGAGPGRRVAILLGNGIDIAVSIFAVHASGAQAVPLNPVYTARELAEILADAEPALLVTDEAGEDLARALALDAGIGPPLVWNAGLRARREAWARDIDCLPAPLPEADTPATLMYTGGTTGRAKGVDISHGQISLNIAQREALLPTRTADERVLCVMPMFHSFAMLMCLHLACHCAGTLVILPRYRPDTVTEALAREAISFFPASPTILTGLLGYAPFAETDLSALRTTLSGSAALPLEILNRWEARTGRRPLEGYGLTEAGPLLTFNPMQGVSKPGSTGIPAPGITIEIVDLDNGDKVLARGEQGEIRARGGQLMSGYRKLPEATAQTLRDGWLYTGDIGELDDEGYLYIRDRKKDLVIISGFNVYPREVDDILYTHPGVTEAGTVGVPDDYRGERLVACVVPRAGHAPSAAQIIEHCERMLAPYKVPGAVRFMDEIPRTAVGKLDRKALRALVLAELAVAG